MLEETKNGNFVIIFLDIFLGVIFGHLFERGGVGEIGLLDFSPLAWWTLFRVRHDLSLTRQTHILCIIFSPCKVPWSEIT